MNYISKMFSIGKLLTLSSFICALVFLPQLNTYAVTQGVGFTHQLNLYSGATMNYQLFQTAVDTIAAQNFSEGWIRLNINDVMVFPRTHLNSSDIDCTPTAPVNCNPTNLQIYKDAFTYAQSQGVKVMAVATVPYWAKLYSNPVNPWETKFSQNVYMSITQDYFTIIGSEFGSYVNKWQIFNEANIHAYDSYQLFGPSLSQDTTYMNQLRKIFDIAHNVLNTYNTGEISTNAGGYPFNQTLYDSWKDYFFKIRRHIDEVGLDMYPDDNAAEIALISDRIQDMNSYIKKSVMVTEIGMCTDTVRFDDIDQGYYVSQYIAESKAGGASHIFAYQLIDNMDTPAPCENNFGIINEDLTQKASFTPVMNALQ